MENELFGFMNGGAPAEPAPPVPAETPASASYDAIVPEVVNGALVPKADAEPLAEARRLMLPWKNNLPQLREFISSFQVATQDDLGVGAKVIGRLKKFDKAAEGARKMLVDPLNQKVKAINSTFAELQTEVKRGCKVLEGVMQTYTARIELERRKAQLAAEQATKELQNKLDAEAKEAGVEAPQVQAPVIAPTPRVLKTDDGTVYTVKRWVCEITDEKLVPREYCTPSQVLLNAAVKGGVREIPGCLVKEIEELRTRT